MNEAQIVVIGAGPAGASAALHLADAGMRVLLVDDKAEPGGAAFPATVDDEAGFLWPDRAYRGAALRQALRDRSDRIAFLPCRRVESIASGPTVTVREMEGGATAALSPRAVVIATGAKPIAAVVPGSTLAGAFGLHDPALLVATARERPGTRVALAGTGPLLWIAAAHCLAARLRVVAIIDAADRPGLRHVAGLLRQPRFLAQGLGWMRAIWKSGVPIHRRSCVTAVQGDDRVREIAIAALDDAWRPVAAPPRRLEADLLGIGFGLRPDIALPASAGIAMDRDPVSGLGRPRRNADMETGMDGVFVVGDAGEVAGLDAALAEGAIAAAAVSRRLGNQAGGTLAETAREARRQRRALIPFLEALNDWAGPRATLIGDQRDR